MNRKFFAAAATMLAAAIAVLVIANACSGVRSAFSFAETDSSQSAEKTVYLTFDDGPSDRITPKILDVLDEEGVKATFFIIGRQAEQRDYLIRREAQSGHTVAVHSYTHNYRDIYSSPEALIADIDKCNAVIEKITGRRSDVYRFPGGSYGLRDELISAVLAHGLRYVDWNASTRDAEYGQADAQSLYNSAVATSADCNNIVLLSHDSTNKTFTPEATRKIIEYYKTSKDKDKILNNLKTWQQPSFFIINSHIYFAIKLYYFVCFLLFLKTFQTMRDLKFLCLKLYNFLFVFELMKCHLKSFF